MELSKDGTLQVKTFSSEILNAFLSKHPEANVNKINMGYSSIPDELLDQMKPILKQLRTLENWHYDRNSQSNIQLHKLCPDLITLSMQPDKRFRNSVTKWPTLKSLSLLDSPSMDDEVAYFAFMKLNPQLEHMQVTNIHCDWTRSIGSLLPNLVSLKIDHDGYSGDCYDTKPLKELKKLEKLALLKFREYDISAVLKYVSEYCTNLIKLKISTVPDRHFDENRRGAAYKRTLAEIQTGLVTIAKTVPRLQILKLYNYTLDTKAVMGFVEVASSLKELHINGEHLRVGPKWIKDMVAVRVSSAATQYGPLKLVINEVELKARNLKLLQSEEIRPYLIIELSDRNFNFF